MEVLGISLAKSKDLLYFAAKYTSPPDRAVLPPPSLRRFSITAESSGTAGQELWRIWEWLVRTLWWRELRRAQMPMLPAFGR
jgi:hypothetical protein